MVASNNWFETLLFLLSAGVISGILSSAPVGPANLWLATALIPPVKPFKNLVAYTVGIITVDILYAFIAFWGYFVYLQDTPLERWVGVIGGVGLGLLGALECKSLYNEKEEESTQEFDNRSKWAEDFFVGAFICGSNPAFVMFWLILAKGIHEYGLENINNSKAIYVFIGIALGDVLWYSTFIKLVKIGLKLISKKVVRYVRGAVAITLIFLGAAAFIKFI